MATTKPISLQSQPFRGIARVVNLPGKSTTPNSASPEKLVGSRRKGQNHPERGHKCQRQHCRSFRGKRTRGAMPMAFGFARSRQAEKPSRPLPALQAFREMLSRMAEREPRHKSPTYMRFSDQNCLCSIHCERSEWSEGQCQVWQSSPEGAQRMPRMWPMPHCSVIWTGQKTTSAS